MLSWSYFLDQVKVDYKTLSMTDTQIHGQQEPGLVICKLLDFIENIEIATGKKAIMEMKDIQAGDVEKTWADVDSLINEFDYKPSTPVADGIKKFVEWYREYYKI